MKSNFNEIFEKMLPNFQIASDISIEDALDEMMPEFKFEEQVTKSRLVRWFMRTRLTSALNHNQIYSYEKGKFVSLANADEEQLKHFMDKAKSDMDAAEVRKSKAEMMLSQISMAWDEDGNFIGYHVPKAVGE
jgi:hypothetical protein